MCPLSLNLIWRGREGGRGGRRNNGEEQVYIGKGIKREKEKLNSFFTCLNIIGFEGLLACLGNVALV